MRVVWIQVVAVKTVEEWSNSGLIWKIGPKEFSDVFEVRCEKKLIQDDIKIVVTNCRDGGAIF